MNLDPWQAFLLGAFVAWIPFGFSLALLICREMEGRRRCARQRKTQ